MNTGKENRSIFADCLRSRCTFEEMTEEQKRVKLCVCVCKCVCPCSK